MRITERVTRGHRAAAVGVLGALAFTAVGVWGIVNLAERDWFIGGLFIACAVVGLGSLVSTVQRMRREERGRSSPPSDAAARRH